MWRRTRAYICRCVNSISGKLGARIPKAERNRVTLVVGGKGTLSLIVLQVPQTADFVSSGRSSLVPRAGSEPLPCDYLDSACGSGCWLAGLLSDSSVVCGLKDGGRSSRRFLKWRWGGMLTSSFSKQLVYR